MPAPTPSQDYYQFENGRGDFIIEFSNRQLNWITAFGCLNNNNSYIDENTIWYDDSGNLIITGLTNCGPVPSNSQCTPFPGDDFPYCPPLITGIEFLQNDNNGGLDAYVAVFSPDKYLSYASFLGGNGKDGATDAFFDSDNNLLYLAGVTNSSQDFPVQFPSGAYMQEDIAGTVDGFVARLNFGYALNTYDIDQLIDPPFSVYPNPTRGIVNFHFTEINDIDIKKLRKDIMFFNSVGQNILPSQENYLDNQIVFTFSNMPNGVYFYRIAQYSGQIIKID